MNQSIPLTNGVCRTFAIWEVERSHEFSPLKNAPGSKSDCPETARNDLLAYHRDLILSHINDANVQERAKRMNIELSPLVTYGGEVRLVIGGGSVVIDICIIWKDLDNISLLVKKSAEGSTLHVANDIEG